MDDWCYDIHDAVAAADADPRPQTDGTALVVALGDGTVHCGLVPLHGLWYNMPVYHWQVCRFTHIVWWAKARCSGHQKRKLAGGRHQNNGPLPF